MNPRVCLVAMPWPSIDEPSLGLGILKAKLKSEGIESRVVHAYTRLLRYLTFETYAFVSSCWGLNEFVFTKNLDKEPDAKQLHRLAQECIDRISANQKIHSKYKDERSLATLFLQLRQDVIPLYLAELAQAILDYKPTMVGFTCMFDQTIASVSLAKIIKEKDPSVLIALGGYALEGPPGKEIIKAFPFIDCIVQGDGEPAICELARSSTEERSLEGIPGMITYKCQCLTENTRIKIALDTSPSPDYEDWFRDINTLYEKEAIEIRGSTLPVESSRGCWYGQARHCIFCGIDDETLKYRSKSPQTVLDMLAQMRSSYGDYNFRFNDYILPNAYYKTLLNDLKKVEPPYKLQCEIKANQTPERLRLFHEAGFTDLQPGIESFSTPVLKLMDKGVRGMYNVLTLKTGYMNRLVIHYNILYGIPNELPEYYLSVLKLTPRLYHLQPPVSRAQTEITRGAPLQVHPLRFGISAIPRHAVLYDVLFSQAFLQNAEFNLDNYAYYFERDYEWGEEMAELYAQLVIQINHWKTRHVEEEVILAYQRQNGNLIFSDSRFGEVTSTKLDKTVSAVYMACDEAPSNTELIAHQLNCPISDVEAAIGELDERRLIWKEENEVLGLGIEMGIVEQHIKTRWRKNWTSLLS